MTISIHQNSFPDASVSGPQVFYFEQSAESSAIASVMQDTLNNSLNPPKPRVCKSNNDYYILKKTPTPIIIVECGFLSNETEAALLVTDAYQEKLVRAVYLGAITYLEMFSPTDILILYNSAQFAQDKEFEIKCN